MTVVDQSSINIAVAVDVVPAFGEQSTQARAVMTSGASTIKETTFGAEVVDVFFQLRYILPSLEHVKACSSFASTAVHVPR